MLAQTVLVEINYPKHHAVTVSDSVSTTMAEGGPPAAPSNTGSDVDERLLASLVDMGIHRDDARQVSLPSPMATLPRTNHFCCRR